LISIIGSGRVGTSIAFLCMSHVLDDVLLVNRSEDKAIGESLDISNSIPSDSEFSIRGTSDYSKIVGSKIVVITASTGVYLQNRSENMVSQVNMIKDIAKKIKRYCPKAIVLLISNPLDVLTYVFQKETSFSRFKIIGIASSLDSSRFRYLLSERFTVPQSLISNALVLGEHGDSMVPVFSGAFVDGNPLSSILNTDGKIIMTNDIRNYWKKLRIYKSRSQFGIAKQTYDVIESILNSKELFIPASVVLEGEYGEKDVAMGIPVKITKNGVSEIQTICLDASESLLLRESSQKIKNQLNSLDV
jgi:malate dehydrogenase